MGVENGVLGIENRTENWKTARLFTPLYDDGDARLKLVERLGESEGTRPCDVRLELFWTPVRDYMKIRSPKERSVIQEYFAAHYEHQFSDLAEKDFGRLRKQGNYNPKNWTGKTWQKKLFNNLHNTEIDIVLQTPKHLFIGEAKHEMDFSADGNLLLVHQLIRQYVTATLLVDWLKAKKILECEQVVPFVVADDPVVTERNGQVTFMRKYYGLKEVLDWNEVKQLVSSR